jgi:hypothetical protein
MADENVIDLRQGFEGQVTHPRSGIDQHIVVDQEGSGSAAFGDGAGAAENANFHGSGNGLGHDSAPTRRCYPMLKAAARRCKGPMSHFAANAPPHDNRRHLDVKSITPAKKAGQAWMNCICVPASSITSPFFRCKVSPTSGLPLMVGRLAPSTWANT